MGKRLSEEDKKYIWGEKAGFKLFLSHLSESKDETTKLKNKLQAFGISSFVAHQDIQPGKQWLEEIKKALYTMDGFCALVTGGFHESDWTDQEIGFALCRDVPIISVNLGGGPPCGFISSMQALSCNWDDAPIKIVKLFMSEQKMINSYIASVRNCSSFDQGNELANLLPAIGELSTSQIKKMIGAFNKNEQVRRSHGFWGDYPRQYGPGLVYHLERLTHRKYRIKRGKIILSD